MNTAYLIYQAERPMSRAEQRQVDIHNAQLYASVTRRLRSLTAPLRAARQRRASHSQARIPSVCAR
jgi:hypothetical protein